MKIVLALVCASALFCSSASAADFVFRGVNFNKTFSGNNIPQCSGVGDKSLCYSQNDWEKHNGIYTLRNLPDIGIDGSTAVNVSDDKITGLDFGYSWTDFDVMVEKLSMKYGKPKAESTQLQNAFGAKKEMRIFSWKQGKFSILAFEFGENARRSVLLVRTAEFIKSQDKAVKEKAKKGVENL